jgi:nucleotide-binding universal stress UspA family protein
MSIACIMVSLDSGRSAGGRVRLAADLARRFESTLIGVAARKIPGLGPVEDLDAAQVAYEEARGRLDDDLARVRAVFDDGVGDGLRTGWRHAEADATAHLVARARGADLLVVGREPEGCAMAVDPGASLMEAGRPLLVGPPGVDGLRAARIVIAWKDAPEARRAVSAALPFLRRADQVSVVAVGRDARGEGAEDVSELLARHGSPVTTHLLNAPAAEAPDELLRFARRAEADLVVMGGYGRSRLRELLFGGTTRAMLRASPLCCLMSH